MGSATLALVLTLMSHPLLGDPVLATAFNNVFPLANTRMRFVAPTNGTSAAREPAAEARSQATDLRPQAAETRSQAPDLLFQSLLRQGTEALQAGQPQAALPPLRRALELQPEHPLALTQLGQALLRSGDPEAAVVSLEQATRLAPDLFSAHSAMAAALLRLHRYEQALAVLSIAGRLGPMDPSILYSQAFALAAVRRAAAGTAAISAEPVTDDDWLTLGRMLANEGTFVAQSRAAAALERALRLNPSDPSIYGELSQTYVRLSLYDDALKLLAGFPAGQSSDGRLELQRGRILLQLARYEEARSALEAAIANGGGAEAHLQLGLAASNLLDHEAALAAFEAAIEIRPDFFEAYLELGELQLGRRQFEAARQTLEHAVELDNKDARALNFLGLATARSGEPTNAVQYLERALELDANLSNAVFNLATTLRELGRVDESLVMMQRFQELDRQRQEQQRLAGTEQMIATLNLQGLHYHRRGEPERAVERFQQALALAPDNDLIHLNLGHAYTAIGDHETALAAFERAVEINPRRAEHHAALATTYRALNRLQDAARAEARYQELRIP